MRNSFRLTGVCAALLAGCASLGDQSSTLSPEQLAECLQPNRRVVVEVNAMVPPKPKPEAKPEAKVEAKPEAKAEAKPAPKPKPVAVQEKLYVQGNSAFEVGSATLKDGAKKEIDNFLARLQKRKATVQAVVISGHVDRLEAAKGPKNLSEQRAQAVRDYLQSKGVDQKLMFWEGRQDRDPVPVTKFCS